ESLPYAYGEWLGAPGKPTVFLYAHHDVQPVNRVGDPKDDWKSDPWKLTRRDGRLFGRGSADDKGAIAGQLAASAAFPKTRALADAAIALNVILSRLYWGNGPIPVPGMYDTVRPLTDKERKTFRALPFNEQSFRDHIGVPPAVKSACETGLHVYEQTWRKPA